MCRIFHLHDDNFHYRLWSHYVCLVRNYIIFAAYTLREHETLTISPCTVLIHDGYMTNPSIKFDDCVHVHSWLLMSFIGHHWQCICGHCTCTILDSCFACSLYNFYRAVTTFKNHLQVSKSNVKAVCGWMFPKSDRNQALKWWFSAVPWCTKLLQNLCIILRHLSSDFHLMRWQCRANH